MSKAAVEAVFGPQWVQDALADCRERARLGEQITLALRAKLRQFDPSLPDIYDGGAWWPFESSWMELE